MGGSRNLMSASFDIGQKLDLAVLLDSDNEDANRSQDKASNAGAALPV